MNKLQAYLNECQKKQKKIVSVFLTLGFPTLGSTGKLISEFEKSGVGIIELGFPYSDPLADGPTIQYASDQALKRQHIHLQDSFRLAAKLRRAGSRIPLVFFTYVNPVLNFGFSKFIAQIKRSGFDGLIIPDLQPDEARGMEKICRKRGISLIHLISPTTEVKRMRRIAGRSQGFIYYVSLRGVTGARKNLANDLKSNIIKIKRMSRKPVLVGFGVSSSKQVRQICRFADGVIVGSAVIDSIRKNSDNLSRTTNFVASLVRASQ